jgi:HJR/Mrr/RecB family endonuclease
MIGKANWLAEEIKAFIRYIFRSETILNVYTAIDPQKFRPIDKWLM